MTLCTRGVITLTTAAAGDVPVTLCTVVGDDEGYGYSFITGSAPENCCF